jgi:hypothetical protein
MYIAGAILSVAINIRRRRGCYRRESSSIGPGAGEYTSGRGAPKHRGKSRNRATVPVYRKTTSLAVLMRQRLDTRQRKGRDKMKLSTVLRKVPGNNLVLIKDYLKDYEYILDDAGPIIDMHPEYHSIKNATVYGIDATTYTYENVTTPMLVISILND